MLGFQNDGFSKKIVENGIFFNSMDFFPIMGYCSWAELISDKARKRYGLPERSCMGDPEDSQARLRNYLTNEGAWIDFEAIVSTCKDQTAVAPGYLVKEWQEGDRRIFHYKMDKPILPFYSILSAHYSIFKDRWNDVDIEIYHHPAHTQNLARMVRSIKRSLSYYTKEFSPYQFRQVRILEFPRYAMMAQAFPNTVPYSEGIGFIAKVNDDPACIDYPFYVTAHEVAHQWWAHQVIGANAKGATMLSESLAQYSAMMVMEKEYGPEQMKKFLRYELDKYLIGRGFESKKELPLVLNENQEYIHYHKGSLAFYALKDRFGEDWVNQILRDFIRDTAFQSAPYPTARDLVQRFKEKAPDELKYIIEDLFETVTMFQHLAVSATYQEQADGKFEVDITTLHNKFRDDQIVPLNDLIDVGVYDEAGRLQYLEKHKIVSGTNVFRIQVDRKPSKAGVDPLNKTLNKLPDQNLAVVKLKTP